MARDTPRYPSPEVSQRVRTTADPIMVQMRRLVGSVDGVLSLGQGTHLHPCIRAHVAPVLRCSRSMTAAQVQTGVNWHEVCCVHTELGTAALCKKTALTPRAQRRAGAVFWAPPPEAIADAAAHAHEAPYSQYGNDEGVEELCAALHAKVAEQNKLRGVRGAAARGLRARAADTAQCPVPGSFIS